MSDHATPLLFTLHNFSSQGESNVHMTTCMQALREFIPLPPAQPPLPTPPSTSMPPAWLAPLLFLQLPPLGFTFAIPTAWNAFLPGISVVCSLAFFGKKYEVAILDEGAMIRG